MTTIIERNNRLYVQVYRSLGVHGMELAYEIDITAHIERAIGNVLSGPLRELIDSRIFASLPGDAFGKKPNVD